MECSEPACERSASYQLLVPWDDDRPVCAGHARTLARQDGVVADALDAADDELPDGAATQEE
jgi:hypothetical protein